MAWGVRWYLVGSVLLGVLGVLAGCSGGNWFAEREPWRREAEVQCLNSGGVKEGAGIVRIKAISGPGMCGADFPLRVSTLGESSPLGYSDDPRPPGAIPGAAPPSRWPIRPREAPASRPEPPPPTRSRVLPEYLVLPEYQVRSAPLDQPTSINPSGTPDEAAPQSEPYDFRRPFGAAPTGTLRAPPPLGPVRGAQVTGAITPVAVSPAATLARPIVSELERWIATAVQPAAMRWFGAPVAEITQISAYSCRGMNGNPRARISEHAFGNALDISAFTLADGRRITVKGGWNGLPEEQGFLRDIQGAACDQFTTVLAPGSNVYHYDHMHVDLMRRSSGHRACNPRAVSGEEVAARAGARYAGRRGSEPNITGALAPGPA